MERTDYDFGIRWNKKMEKAKKSKETEILSHND